MSASLAAINILFGNVTATGDSQLTIYRNTLTNSLTSGQSVSVVQWDTSGTAVPLTPLNISLHSFVSLNSNSITNTRVVAPASSMPNITVVYVNHYDYKHMVGPLQVTSSSFVDMSYNFIANFDISSPTCSCNTQVVNWIVEGIIVAVGSTPTSYSAVTLSSNAISNSTICVSTVVSFQWVGGFIGLSGGSSFIAQGNTMNNVKAIGTTIVSIISTGSTTFELTKGSRFAAIGNSIANCSIDGYASVVVLHTSDVNNIVLKKASQLMVFGNSLQSSSVAGPISVVDLYFLITLTGSSTAFLSNNSLYNVTCTRASTAVTALYWETEAINSSDRSSIVINNNGVVNSTILSPYWSSRVRMSALGSLQITNGSLVSFNNNYALSTNFSSYVYLVDWQSLMHTATITDSVVTMDGNRFDSSTVDNAMFLCSWSYATMVMSFSNSTFSASRNLIRNATAVQITTIVYWAGGVIDLTGGTVFTFADNSITAVNVQSPSVAVIVSWESTNITLSQSSALRIMRSVIHNVSATHAFVAAVSARMEVKDSSVVSVSNSDLEVMGVTNGAYLLYSPQGISLGGVLAVENNVVVAPSNFKLVDVEAFTSTSLNSTVQACNNSLSFDSNSLDNPRPYLLPSTLATAAVSCIQTSSPDSNNNNNGGPSNSGIVAGAVIGSIAGLALVGGAFLFLHRRRSGRADAPPLMERESGYGAVQ